MGEVFCAGNREYCLLRRLIPDEDLSAILTSGDIFNSPVLCSPEIIQDVRDNCQGNCVRKIVVERKYTQRQLEQWRCVDDYKWKRSQEEGHDIGYELAWTEWIQRGFAKAFSEVWKSRNKTGPVRHWDLYVRLENDFNTTKQALELV